MKVRLGPQATRTGKMLQESGTPSCGWITGQLMGRIWLVETMIPMDLLSQNLEQDFKVALEHLNSDLLGVFFAHMPVSPDDRFRGDLVLRIQAEGIDAVIFSAETGASPEMNFFSVFLSGGLHAERNIDEQG